MQRAVWTVSRREGVKEKCVVESLGVCVGVAIVCVSGY